MNNKLLLFIGAGINPAPNSPDSNISVAKKWVRPKPHPLCIDQESIM
jgi:hypothetical protein